MQNAIIAAVALAAIVTAFLAGIREGRQTVWRQIREPLAVLWGRPGRWNDTHTRALSEITALYRREVGDTL